MELLSLKQVRQAVQRGPAGGRVHVQVEAAAAKVTREQKPYCELVLADAADRMTLRVWSDNPNYKACDSLQPGEFIEIAGEFYQHQQFGLDARGSWKVRALSPQERTELLQGPAELRAKQAADLAFIIEKTEAIGDPRLRALCVEFLSEWGERVSRDRRRAHLSSMRAAADWSSMLRK